MPRRSVLKVVKVNYTPSAPWMVRVPSRLQSTEGSQKKFFEKESVAKAYAERLARQMGEYQTQALGLTDRQKVEAAECYRILGKEDASLLEAVHHYVAYLAQAKQSLPIRQLFEEFLATKRQDGLSSKYLADLRSNLGRFVAAFSDTLACNLTAPTLEAWLRGLKMGSVSRESYRRNISVMLEFGRRRGALHVNPAADIKITRRPEGEVTILSPEDVARLLECCTPDLKPYVAICAFAGLRPSEAASLDWSNIHFDTLQVEVKARHSKTRRHRLVPMQSNLVAWLQPHKVKNGPIGYPRRKFRAAYKAAGMEHWKTDVLRHSYGTFRLPILKSADALALEMGNSAAVIFRHYRRPMTEADAQRYFDLFPAKPALQSEAAKPIAEDSGSSANANASQDYLWRSQSASGALSH